MTVPHAKSSPPWSDCGAPKSPDFGTVFADRPFEGTVGLWFDRAMERRFACRVAVADLGDEIVIAGRRFGVVRAEEGLFGLPSQECAGPLRVPTPARVRA